MKDDDNDGSTCAEVVFECDLCDINFVSMSHFQQHRIYEHGKIGDVNFPNRANVYSSQGTRSKVHASSNGGTKENMKGYACGVCHTIFYILDEVLDHLDSHTKLKENNESSAFSGKIDESFTTGMQGKSSDQPEMHRKLKKKRVSSTIPRKIDDSPTKGSQNKVLSKVSPRNPSTTVCEETIKVKESAFPSKLSKKSDRDVMTNAKEMTCGGDVKSNVKNSKNEVLKSKRRQEKGIATETESPVILKKELKLEKKISKPETQGNVKTANPGDSSTTGDLRMKIRISGGEIMVEKDKECQLCQRTYSNIQKLKQHLRKFHKLIKVFLCNVCCKNFASFHNLRRHSIIHGPGKEFLCSVCHKSFTRKDHKNHHEHKLHGIPWKPRRYVRVKRSKTSSIENTCEKPTEQASLDLKNDIREKLKAMITEPIIC